MSFAMTTAQIAAKVKTVTRRTGWQTLKPGTLLQPVVKAQGLKKGEKVTKIGGPIRVTDVRFEPLNLMTWSECQLEGFPDMHPTEFVAMFRRANGCKADAMVTRIAFEFEG